MNIRKVVVVFVVEPDQFCYRVEVVGDDSATGGDLEGLSDHGPVVEVGIVDGEVQHNDSSTGTDPEVSLHLRHHELGGGLVLPEDLRVAAA